jgi:hypothetical protein
MGVVYKARDTALDRWVAVKTLLPSLAGDPEARERFLREARAAAALSHPNLAQIYSIGEGAGIPYFAMEFIEGQTLAQKIEREGKIRSLEAIRLVRQVALGLQEAYRFQLVHRDIKPANLILSPDGTLKVTDFGLAKRAQGPGSMHLTATGQTLGSPLYMSPEQGRGLEADHRSDIYSLGATFFHLLTGRPPFQAASPMDVVMKHIQEPAPSPRSFAPEVSYPLAGLVQRMLRKRPDDRFPSYPALLEELERVEAAERSDTSVRRAVPVWVKQEKRSSWMSVAGFVALCAAAALMGLRMVRAGLREWRQMEGTAQAERTEEAQTSSAEQARGEAAGGRRRGRLQVDAVGAAHEAAGPRERSTSRLSVLGLSQQPVPPAGMRVSGHILNQGNAPARGVRVEVRIFDASDILLASEIAYPPRDPIGGGETVPFEAFFRHSGAAERIEAEVIWSQ